MVRWVVLTYQWGDGLPSDGILIREPAECEGAARCRLSTSPARYNVQSLVSKITVKARAAAWTRHNQWFPTFPRASPQHPWVETDFLKRASWLHRVRSHQVRCTLQCGPGEVLFEFDNFMKTVCSTFHDNHLCFHIKLFLQTIQVCSVPSQWPVVSLLRCMTKCFRPVWGALCEVVACFCVETERGKGIIAPISWGFSDFPSHSAENGLTTEGEKRQKATQSLLERDQIGLLDQDVGKRDSGPSLSGETWWRQRWRWLHRVLVVTPCF